MKRKKGLFLFGFTSFLLCMAILSKQPAPPDNTTGRMNSSLEDVSAHRGEKEAHSANTITINSRDIAGTTKDMSPLSETTGTPDSGPDLEMQYQSLSDNPDYPTLSMRLMEMKARRNGMEFDEKAVVDALAQPELWEMLDTTPTDLELTEDELYDGREFVSFNPVKLESLVPGDTLDIPVYGQNETYRMKVETVQVNSDVDVTWHGTLIDFNEDNQVSITQGISEGESVTAGGVSTPFGHYTLHVHKNKGWLASSGDLFEHPEEDQVFPEDEPIADAGDVATGDTEDAHML